MLNFGKKKLNKQKQNKENILLQATTDEYTNLDSILVKINDESKFDWLAKLNMSILGSITLASISASVFVNNYSESINKQKVEMSIKIEKLDNFFQKITKHAGEMSVNPEKSILELEKNKNYIDQVIKEINKNKNHINETSIGPYTVFLKNWEQIKKHIDIIINNRNQIVNSEQKILNIKKNFNILSNSAENLKNEIIVINNSTQNIEFAYGFYLNTIKMLNDLKEIRAFYSEDKKQEIIKRLETTAVYLKIIENTYDSNYVKITESRKNFEILLKKTINLEKENKNLDFIKSLYSNDIFFPTKIEETQHNLQIIKNLIDKNVKHDFLGFPFNFIKFILFSISVFFLILMSISLYAKSITTLKLVNLFKKNQSNEEALSELLEQIKPLDNGDFTKPIFVDDKFLFNISKKIDKTRVQFGDIVRQMKSSSTNILNVAGTTDQSSQELLTLSKKEYEKLSESIESINKITSSIDKLAKATWKAKDESLKSHVKSEKGTKLVKESIEKMNEVRNTIQESSKKIKKLGESAQSITEVTGLIKDITKKINILALNAAIQAASSGESGREFTIVAQEVQRLAYDSEEATQKIEELIKDIQDDTYIAISSMEKTTQEVVIGSNLIEQTGNTLLEIRKLSESTSSQIMDASSKLEEKSSEMANLTFEMQGLQEISKVAQQALDITATQVEKLKLVSMELEETFKKYKV